MHTQLLTFAEVDWSNPVGAALREAQQRELAVLAGDPQHEPGPPPSSADMPIFLVAYKRSSGEPLGCGGLRRLDGHTAEVKRVYVVPYARGSGVSFEILDALEARAVQEGFLELRAEAGSFQHNGRRFYERGGYSVIPGFGPYAGNADSRCYAKALRRTAAVG
jgi:GNAT superfamily N-acetyltransferase